MVNAETHNLKVLGVSISQCSAIDRTSILTHTHIPSIMAVWGDTVEESVETKNRLEDGQECHEISSGQSMAIAHMNSQKLWLHV